MTAGESRTDAFMIKALLSLQLQACIINNVFAFIVAHQQVIITGLTLSVKAIENIQTIGTRARKAASHQAGLRASGFPFLPHSGTHILDQIRSDRFAVPVNGSLCNYDYVEPCAPGTRLNHRLLTCF